MFLSLVYSISLLRRAAGVNSHVGFLFRSDKFVRCGKHSDSLPRWEHPKGKPLPVSLRATTLPKGEGNAFPSGKGGTVIAVTEEAVFLKEGGKEAQQFCNCPANWNFFKSLLL